MRVARASKADAGQGKKQQESGRPGAVATKRRAGNSTWSAGSKSKSEGTANRAWGTRSPEAKRQIIRKVIVVPLDPTPLSLMRAISYQSVNSVSNDPQKMLEESKSKQHGSSFLPEVQAKTSGLPVAATEFVPKTSSQAKQRRKEALMAFLFCEEMPSSSEAF
ncbi:unnamed protein product [Symbiodinium sp. CCMP2592]|nr:unnamed protein product [Symbiodinium sp. CCMP2592]